MPNADAYEGNRLSPFIRMLFVIHFVQLSRMKIVDKLLQQTRLTEIVNHVGRRYM